MNDSHQTSPKIVFMGTPEFAAHCLGALHKVFPVSAVVTVEDKPVGRGLKIAETAVKKKAIELGISTILQPPSLKDDTFVEQLQALQPDIIVVIAFKILPKKVYSLSKLGSFNIHGSLLPKFRGAAPIQWAIIRGETETGVTSFLLSDTVDTGSILGKKSLQIDSNWTAGDLHDAMMPLAAQLTIDTCSMLISGNYTPIEQNDREATTAPKLFRENSKIDWNLSTNDVYNFVRGMNPFPTAWTLFDNEVLKVQKVTMYEGGENVKPNEYLLTSTHFLVGCSEGVVSIETLQLPNKSKVNAKDFLRGYRGNRSGILA